MARIAPPEEGGKTVERRAGSARSPPSNAFSFVLSFVFSLVTILSGGSGGKGKEPNYCWGTAKGRGGSRIGEKL